MAIEQVAFFVPSYIQQGIDSGIFVRCGGVIRNTKGQIIKHLDELPAPKENSNLAKAINFVSKHKVAFGIGVATATVAAVGIVYIIIKNKKNEEIEIPKCIVDFNDALSLYFHSIKSSDVSEEIIDQLIIALDEVKKNYDNGNIDLILSVENINLLVDIVKEYTIKFAEANSFELPDVNTINNDNKIINLRNYLNIQKEIFEKCS